MLHEINPFSDPAFPLVSLFFFIIPALLSFDLWIVWRVSELFKVSTSTKAQAERTIQRLFKENEWTFECSCSCESLECTVSRPFAGQPGFSLENWNERCHPAGMARGSLKGAREIRRLL